jgi:photosystem II stability/assembly factor-like uncharacterized protein
MKQFSPEEFTNGGSSWQTQTSGAPQWLNSVYFVDSKTGWAVGENGAILKYNCDFKNK